MKPTDVDKRIHRALASVRRPFRGRLKRTDNAHGVNLAQIDGLNGEQLQAAEIAQHYGFTSNPLEDCQVVVLPLGGKTAHGIIIATEDSRYRMKALAPGEVAIYSDEGDYVVFKRTRVMEINTRVLNIKAIDKVVIDTPRVECTHDLIDQTAGGNAHTVKNMREIYNDHTHADPQGGSVAAPASKM